MKKVIFSLLLIGTASIFAVNAQTASAPFKLGVYNEDAIVQSMPEFKTVIQPALNSYRTDSLIPKQNAMKLQFNRLDSIYLADSAAKKPQAVLDVERNQLVQLSQSYPDDNNAMLAKYYQIAQPYYEKVNTAYQKVVADNHVTLVVTPQAFQQQIIFDVPDKSSIVDLTTLVAKAMGVTLENGQSQQAQQ